jgi:3-methyladenine DNA glycosylase/8-oxoguanine DNA glycosylase
MPAPFDAAGGLGFDPATAIEQLRSADAVLARVIDTIGPFRLQVRNTSSVFAALAQAIVYQQLTGKAAATIFARFCALFPAGPDAPTPEHVLAASDEELRGAGLSRSKALSLRDLAQRTASGEIPTLAEIRVLEDDAIIERLTKVRGIGRWTVEMLLIFRLGRPDVLPVDDYGVRKGFALAYQRELPSPKELAAFGARWKPHRTIPSWYFWRVVERATARKVVPLGSAEER